MQNCWNSYSLTNLSTDIVNSVYVLHLVREVS